ncbi:MAG: hypothetical protein WCD86_23985, partial [Ktedonobacteraceae bacterium]
EKPYDLYHTNVDGGGWINSFATVHEAKAEADRLQEESDRHGNWWQYRYHVFGLYGRKQYETVSNDELVKLARSNEQR